MNDNAPAKQVSIVDATATISLERDSYASVAPLTRILAAQANDQDFDIRAMRRVVEHIHNRHEYQVLSLLSTSGNYTTTADPGNFTTSTVSLILPVKVAMDTISSAIGFDPDTVVINPDVARYLESLDEVKGWNGRSFNNAATPASHSQLAEFFMEMFGLELHIATMKYTNASGTLLTPWATTLRSTRLTELVSPRSLTRSLTIG